MQELSLRKALVIGLISAVTASPASGRLPAGIDDSDTVDEIRELPTRSVSEVIWLARCIYSETNRPHEQRLVAWVVRNRVETQFRGRTYREVVLTPRQFSAFNKASARRRHLLNLTLDSNTEGWQQALETAYQVYTAPSDARPFPATTRHFYSPRSRPAAAPPAWTTNHVPLSASSLGILPQRFKFYDGIDRQNQHPAASSPEVHAAENVEDPPSGVTTASSEAPRLSLEKLREHLGSGVKLPRRPTVRHPSRPDRQQQ